MTHRHQWNSIYWLLPGLLAAVALLGLLGGFQAQAVVAAPAPQQTPQSQPTTQAAGVVTPTQQAAAQAGVPINAVGTVELQSKYQVVLQSSGIVDDIAVEVGDVVKQGDLLMSLDTAELERGVEQAEINFETARLAFEELTKPPEDSDVAVAEANLLLAKERLALVEAGPTAEELAATQSSASAAWARYEELKEGPTPAQVNQALANLKKAEIDVQQAQREFDKIAWLPEAAASAAADSLQKATIDLELAQANFDEVNKPATQAELQSALAAAQRAQDDLNKLKEKPTTAELAEARANVTAAEQQLADVKRGPTEAAVRTAELRVQEALINLEQARENLDNAQVLAPVGGTVLEIAVEQGQQGSPGSVVATLADTNKLWLMVNVEQKDISRVNIGQAVDIAIYALPGVVFKGEVAKVAPVSQTGTAFVTFPVTIRLVDESLDGIRPGMTASATFKDGE
jgi:HlyD family secretion protein